MPEPGALLFRRPNAWSSVQGDLLPPSPPAEKATPSRDQAGQASTGDWAGHRRCDGHRKGSAVNLEMIVYGSTRLTDTASLTATASHGTISPNITSSTSPERSSSSTSFRTSART